MSNPINHPAHYGGGDNPYEAIKVIKAWDLGVVDNMTIDVLHKRKQSFLI